MKKAYELSTLTGTQVLLLVASETGHVYTFATPKLQPLITKPEGKNLIQACLNAPDTSQAPPSSQSTSRISSYPTTNSTPQSEPSPQMIYHPQEQNNQNIPMQSHLFDEKPKITGFNNRGSIGDNKYVDPNIASMDVNYPSSASFNAPPSLMNPMRAVPYHGNPLTAPRNSYQSMGSPSSNPPNQSYPPQYASQPTGQYPIPQSMAYPQGFHPSNAASSSHLYSSNQKPNMSLPINSSGQQHQMTGDYKYMSSNNSMEYPYSHR